MIKLESNKMQKAIERAKAVRPRVTVINADDRTYSVTGSKGNRYTVRFVVVNGMKLAECDCVFLCDVNRLPVREVVSATHYVTDLTLGLGEVVHDYLAKD